ncbi:MAG: 3-keto-5-aminohexanoate cleavage protein [Promethearchaeota archaeon]|jgi:3-keto-5-aminohexanoate cleavage enzyme
MAENLSNKLVISAALAGSATMKSQNPAVPYTPEEFGIEAKKCFNAGATTVHIHARDLNTGFPTPDLDRIRAVVESIKEHAPEIIINITSSVGLTLEQRVAPTNTFKPAIASLNTNSMNFGIGNFKTGEVVANADGIFRNTFLTIETLAKAMKKAKTKPELEVYDFGGLYNILFLDKQEGLFEHPFHFQFVFGTLGGVPFSYQSLAGFLNLMPSGSSWSVCGVAKDQFRAGLCAAAMGGHIRVGLEDNIRVPDGELAKGSWEQVEWAAKVAKLAGREVATPDETRKIFNLLQ